MCPKNKFIAFISIILLLNASSCTSQSKGWHILSKGYYSEIAYDSGTRSLWAIERNSYDEPNTLIRYQYLEGSYRKVAAIKTPFPTFFVDSLCVSNNQAWVFVRDIEIIKMQNSDTFYEPKGFSQVWVYNLQLSEWKQEFLISDDVVETCKVLDNKGIYFSTSVHQAIYDSQDLQHPFEPQISRETEVITDFDIDHDGRLWFSARDGHESKIYQPVSNTQWVASEIISGELLIFTQDESMWTSISDPQHSIYRWDVKSTELTSKTLVTGILPVGWLYKGNKIDVYAVTPTALFVKSYAGEKFSMVETPVVVHSSSCDCENDVIFIAGTEGLYFLNIEN